MPNDVVRLPVRERKLHADPARSYTLPARYYTSPEIYKQEAEAIFFRTWQFAGHVGDLPEIGSYITCQILDQNIIIARRILHCRRISLMVHQYYRHVSIRHHSGRLRIPGQGGDVVDQPRSCP